MVVKAEVEGEEGEATADEPPSTEPEEEEGEEVGEEVVWDLVA